MKKLIVLIMCLLLVAVSFTGCTYSEGEHYRKFADNHQAGMTKREIYIELGCPDLYKDEQGYFNSETPDFETNILADTSVEWIYKCDAVPRSTGGYVLRIYFDSDGKSTDVWLHTYS